MKSCSNINCKQVNPQPLSNFNKNKKGKNGLYCHCKFCQRITNKNRYIGANGRLKRWQRNLQRRYWPTLSVEEAYLEYMKMYNFQKGLCVICELPEREMDGGTLKVLAVDHCHKTGNVRALLCHRCNRGIGQLLDSSLLCLNAAFYLSQY